MPVRIQRKRTKGWRMPEGAVYVGRPTKWGNPYKIGATHAGIDPPHRPIILNAAMAVELFRLRECQPSRSAEMARELRGRDLACFCPLDQPCHADVLIELANR